MTTPAEPIRSTDLPPLPPSAPPSVPVGSVGFPAGADQGPLVDLSGEPIPPTSPEDPLIVPDAVMAPVVAPVREPVVPTLAEQIQRVGRDVVLVGLVAGLALILAVVAGGFALAARNDVAQTEAHQIAADTERVRVDAIQRDSICTVAGALRATNSAAARESFPGGTGPYDVLMAQISKAAVTLNCDAG